MRHLDPNRRYIHHSFQSLQHKPWTCVPLMYPSRELHHHVIVRISILMQLFTTKYLRASRHLRAQFIVELLMIVNPALCPRHIVVHSV